MTKKLFVSAIGKFLLGVLLVGLLLFLPAGTLRWPGGWLLMAILFLPMFAAGIFMMVKNPSLLESRLKAKEEQRTQQTVVKLSGLMFICGFILAGLDFRHGWFPLPDWVRYLAAMLFLAAYVLYAEVLRENTWLSRTIGVQEGQQVVDRGLYGIVRHPMYAATLLLFLAMPLVLGSLIALGAFLAYPFLITARIRNEEQVLEKELAGYVAYERKVPWRLIPFIW